ncbi:hypothetical protein JOE50_005886 [Bradyrhizobium japonicum]|nr:hypothetical protein [Bradyrhizobium japonicum]
MSVALRKCEHAFNEDVLPPHAKVAEPLEFYAASKLMLLPHVAASDDVASDADATSRLTQVQSRER